MPCANTKHIPQKRWIEGLYCCKRPRSQVHTTVHLMEYTYLQTYLACMHYASNNWHTYLVPHMKMPIPTPLMGCEL